MSPPGTGPAPRNYYKSYGTMPLSADGKPCAGIDPYARMGKKMAELQSGAQP